MRQVPILNPGIHNRQGYVPYDQGLAQDVFIKDITGKPYVGQVRGVQSVGAATCSVPGQRLHANHFFAHNQSQSLGTVYPDLTWTMGTSRLGCCSCGLERSAGRTS